MSKYFITPNFPDFNALTLYSDFDYYSDIYLHNSTVSPDLRRGQDYSFISSLGLKDNTVYWVLTFDDFTNFHYIFIDLFDSILDPSENLSILDGVPQRITFIITNIFSDLPDFNYGFGGEIFVYKEQIFLPRLYFGGNHFIITFFDAPLFCGLIDGRPFSFLDFSKMIFEKASAYGLEYVGIDGVIQNNTNQPPLNGVLFQSLNGADGSLADGTPVTVINRDGAFKVLASRNYYNDAKEKQNMLFYLLERTDLEHKPTMLVADVHVQKVV